ncbi:DUF4124 domain-containing protein [Dasania sp. GY-MA-18]|uniref:DUF4124 domain-containing protein n=1 Tax=Dasania phycosphaerae TaxID=2950436 RepID=A0A9J6RPU9_9GAMM|nr:MULTISPECIES: DUF4124 domain-containing protein [Dasania]MCR8923619.1 DUF4124 domain-containing protein [Dasania sp. GY-MA-18]MCZ0866053.1 DUF4124 domain-containing protein [Dasania phycosphaerae]MCZ0869777.1 DUF4124 domain-containing protein [Dasania phycosphaerae]
MKLLPALVKFSPLIFLLAVNSYAQVYKWVDEQGNVHYSDSKPAQQNVEEKHFPTGQSSIDPELESYRQAIKKNELARQRQRAYQQQQQAETKEKAKKRKRYCDNLKAKQHIDNRVSMWRTQNPDGTVTAWTGEQRKQYTQALQDNYNKHCR